MATVPLSGTDIRFLSGVPFSNDYKNTRWFDDISSQTTYFQNRTIVYSVTEANFQRIDGYNFIAVNKSIDELWGTNYLMFQNTSYNSKWFYAFVTKLEYRQRNTTYVHFEIDVLQTWMFDMNFKPSFVVREHCPLWNADGSPVINTVDEGLNYGTEYKTMYVDNYVPFGQTFFLVIVAKNRMDVNYNGISPTLNGSPQPLTYYVHPFNIDGSVPSIKVDGIDQTISSINDVLLNLYKLDVAVNNIVSLYVTEYIGHNSLDFPMVNFEPVNIQDPTDVNTATNIVTLHVRDLSSYEELTHDMGAKYTGLTMPTESKLLMYPYTVTILDDFKGNRIEIKNEYVDNANLILTVKGSIGTSNKVSFNLQNYLIEGGGTLAENVNLEHALINNVPNDVPIITDLLSAYLQGNKNSLENQRKSITYNGMMDVLGNAVGGIGSAVSRNPIGVGSSVLNIEKGAGNAILKLQGIEAKIKDINNVPPQINKMGSNTAFDYGNGYTGVFIIKKQITEEYQKKLSDFFNMYGYKKNEVKIPNFHTRQNWNYVQTTACNITGNFNNEDLNELKSVFDNGITLWHTDDVGNYSLGNGVI